MDADNKIYIGLVISNNDPELRGRIKIYIPQIGPNIPEINTNVDKFFTFIGQESNSIVSEVLETLKNILPWAEYAGPIAGGNASGRYNGFVGEGTTSDSNAWKDGKVAEGLSMDHLHIWKPYCSSCGACQCPSCRWWSWLEIRERAFRERMLDA
jgi:hypothetical protein